MSGSIPSGPALPGQNPLGRVQSSPGAPAAQRPLQNPAGPSFQELLQRQVQQGAPLKFSAHASKRLAESGRSLTPGELGRVAAAVEKAAGKGARDSLVLLPDLALVVSVQNRTVITAVEGPRMKDNVFTQIDSAVIA